MTPSQENISAESPLDACPPLPSHNQNSTQAESAAPVKPSARFRVINATLPQTRFIVDGINALIASDDDAAFLVTVDGVVSVSVNKPSYLMALLGLCKIECKCDESTVAFILPEWLEVAR